MARKQLYANATQDANGMWWAETEDQNGNPTKVRVMPSTNEDGNTVYTQASQEDVLRAGGVTDQSIIDRLVNGQQPAGFDENSKWFVPGQEISPDYFSQVIARLNQPGAYEGVSGMTAQQYLADPRSAVKVENGKLVYRPEQMQGDYASVDRESFLQSLGAIPAILGMAAGPFMQVAGIGSLGSAGAAAGSAGAEFFPNVHSMLGDVASMGSGAAGGAAGAATGASVVDYPMQGGSYAMETSTLPTTVANDFSLASQGAGYGGVGTGGTGLSLGANSAGGLIGETAANLASAGGTQLGTLAGIGAGTGAGLGLELGTTGGTIGTTASNLANAAGVGLDTITNAGSGIGTGVNVAGTAGTVAASTVPQTAASALSSLLKQYTGMDLSPGVIDLIGKGLGAGIGYLGTQQQTSALTNLQNQLNSQRAPFLNKAVGYLNNPDSFYTSPEATGAANAVLRQLSAGHGNPALSPTAQSLATGALYDRYSNTVNSLGSLGLSGQGIQANLGQQIASSSGQPYAIAGNLASGLTSDSLDVNKILAQALQKQFSLA